MHRPSRPTIYFYPRPPRGGRRPGHPGAHQQPGHFYPRPPRGGRLPSSETKSSESRIFLPTPSARRATDAAGVARVGDDISTHALREEGDSMARPRLDRKLKFLPTPSARRATWPGGQHGHQGHISTHALREEGDLRHSFSLTSTCRFLPTPSARRATFLSGGCVVELVQFLPTPSARRATRPWMPRLQSCYHFYPRPPRGGRRAQGVIVQRCHRISTHALREEGDLLL